MQMHEKALLEERKKFANVLRYPYSSRSRANRRTDSHAESSGTNTPINPTSPAPVGEVSCHFLLFIYFLRDLKTKFFTNIFFLPFIVWSTNASNPTRWT